MLADNAFAACVLAIAGRFPRMMYINCDGVRLVGSSRNVR